MRIFLYGFGAFIAVSALLLFGLGSTSGGLFFLLVALVVFGIGAWVHYEQDAPIKQRLVEAQVREQEEIQQRQKRALAEEQSRKWLQEHNSLYREASPKATYVSKEYPPRLKEAQLRRDEELRQRAIEALSNQSSEPSEQAWLDNRRRPEKQKFGVSHRGAEELAAEWLVYLGEQRVKITPYSNDGGADVLTDKYCCQVKNYEQKPVSVVEVRALLGTAVSMNLKPLLFTASKPTNAALIFCKETDIAVVEFDAPNALLFGLTPEGHNLLKRGRY